jgi:hypothetical protein
MAKDTGDTPKYDLAEHGPCEPIPPPNNVVFFFIYHKDSQPDYELIKSYFEKGFKTHPNLQDFIYQPFFIDETQNIVFDKLETAPELVYKILER